MVTPKTGTAAREAPGCQDVIVSTVRCAVETTPLDLSVCEVLKTIRTGGKKLKGQITQIRNRFESELAFNGGDFEKAKRAVEGLKKDLPGVTWSGTFSYRANGYLVRHSGLLGTDLDLLGGELPRVREQLKTSPHLVALFVSPTGNGLKAVFRVHADAGEHAASFRAVEGHVLEQTGVQIDGQCKDVSRLCFMSFDPDIYVNWDATAIEPLPEPEKQKTKTSSSSSSSCAGRNSKPGKAEIREMLSFIPKRPHYHDWIRIVSAVGDALSLDDAIEVLTEWSEEEEKGEYADKLRHPLDDIHIGTLIHLARQHGWTGRTQAKSESKSAGGALPPLPPSYVPPPLDLFPAEVKRFIRVGAATFDVDRAFFLLPVLSGAAAMIGNARSIRLKEDYIEPPILWTAVIASTGEGKSPVGQAATAPLRMREREFIRKNKEAEKQFVSDLAGWEARPKKDRGEKPQKPPLLTCWMDDTTIEAVASRLNDNPRGVALFKDEFSHWFESMDQYHDRNGSDVSRWLSIWTGNLFALDRVTGGRSYRIANPRLSITGGVVPEKFQHLLTDDFFVRGLPARFLFAMPTRNRPRKWIEESIPPEVKAEVNELFAQLAALPPHKNKNDEDWPVLLGLSAEAQRVFVDFYGECARRAFDADIREAAQWSKLSAYSARLALVGQLLWDPKAREVSGEVMRAACELARWFGNEAERIYALISETPEQRAQRKLIQFIENRGGTVTVRDVMQNYHPLKNQKDETERQLNALVKAGLGKWEEVRPTGPGRPTRVFHLLFSTQFSDLRGEPDNCVGVDTRDVPGNNSTENVESPECKITQEDAITTDCVSQSHYTSTYTQFPNPPSVADNSVDLDPQKSPEMGGIVEVQSQSGDGEGEL